MSEIHKGDRVVCIDATPIPISPNGLSGTDFTFPGGFIAEGDVYFVSTVAKDYRGGQTLRLVGHPVLACGREVHWNGLRFRKLSAHTAIQQAEKAIQAQPNIPVPIS
ncbi:hypothetical protein [Haloferula sp.]|uniref:hypothetical protein n=1 Tax=Haloferula sp. TaxID=2497595 RepID=UPI003C74D988